MTEHAVVIAGGGPTGLMLLASCRWPASTLSSSNDAPTTRSTGREPVICRPELWGHARGLRQAPGSCGKGQWRKREAREARRG
jgi:hypothetical protein